MTTSISNDANDRPAAVPPAAPIDSKKDESKKLDDQKKITPSTDPTHYIDGAMIPTTTSTQEQIFWQQQQLIQQQNQQADVSNQTARRNLSNVNNRI